MMTDQENNYEEIDSAEDRQQHPRMRRLVKYSSTMGVIALALIALLIVPNLVAFSPSFCDTCHVDQHATWTHATHKNVTCTDCHIPRDAWSAFKARLGMLDKLVVKAGLSPGNHNITGFELKPPNANCDYCHKAKRDITPGGDLIIPHAAHTKLRKLLCVDCHKELVHSAKAKVGNKPSMTGCYVCHDGKKAPNSCSACHTEKALPNDHRAPDWLRVHSQVQQHDPAYCDGCHGWVKDYCNECHKRQPRSHDATWPQVHQGVVDPGRKAGCAKCHGQKCNSCHTKTVKIARPKGY
jgi:hypothetical protein